MKPKHILGLLLLAMAMTGASSAYFDVRGIPEPAWSTLGSTLGFSALTFWWYWADSELRTYRRSPFLSICVVAMGLLAIPYYVLRSRAKGERLSALMRMLGFLALLVAALFIGTLPSALIG